MDKKIKQELVYLLKDFGEHLQRIRKSRFNNAGTLAGLIGIGGSTYNGYETGQHFPDLAIMLRIVKHLKISFDQLFEPFLIKPRAEVQRLLNRVETLYANSQTNSFLIESIGLLELKLRIEEHRKEEAKEEEPGGERDRGSPQSGQEL